MVESCIKVDLWCGNYKFRLFSQDFTFFELRNLGYLYCLYHRRIFDRSSFGGFSLATLPKIKNVALKKVVKKYFFPKNTKISNNFL